jgi:hypothetical protein
MTPAYGQEETEEERLAREVGKKEAREDADALRTIMRSKNGRAWLYRLLAKCNVYGPTFEPGHPDITAFRLGQENIGKQLMLDCMAASDQLYILMLSEQREEEKRLAKVRRADVEAQTPEAIDAEETLGVNAHMIDLPPPEGWAG